ncbi:MAG: ATP-binding protein, partial [Streptosporangiales bacterium]
LRRVEVLAGELQVVMDSTDEGIYRRDVAGRITYINRAALEQTGYTAGELLGRDAHHMLHHTRPDGTDYPAADCPLQQVLDDRCGAQFSGEVFWRKDGTPFPIDCSAYPFFDGDQVTGIVVTFRDISERKVSENQVAAQYQTARALVEAASLDEAEPRILAIHCEQLGWQVCAVWEPDGDGGPLRCRTAAGRPGTEEQVALLKHATLVAGHGAVGRAWQEREPVFEGDLAGRTPGRPGGAPDCELAVPFLRDGRVAVVIQMLGPARLATGEMITTIQTIGAQVAQFTERKETEAAAAQMKDQFVATVSHELRTPLAAMDGWLHILLDGDPGPLNDDQRRFLSTVKRNSDRLMRLVGDLLLIGQMDAGRFSLDLSEVDIAELVGETVALFTGPAAEKGIELTASTGPSATVHGDRLRLGQLLSNLVSNAIKFTPENGAVQVRASGQGERCLIEVTDSGVGIPAGERAHLFERFYRASTAAGTVGSGLGLAISKAIAEGHGGTIRVAEAEGGGTRFVVELPLTVRAEATL